LGKTFEDEKRKHKELIHSVAEILSNDVNLTILRLLSLKPSYNRELASIIGRDETDISRRLKQMEQAGLVKGVWKRLGGRNVKVYELKASSLSFTFLNGRIEVNVKGSPSGLSAQVIRSVIPSVDEVIGREEQLRIIREGYPVVVVAGPPGIGKTALVAYYIKKHARENPVYWHYSSYSDSRHILSWKLTLFIQEFIEKKMMSSSPLPLEVIVDYINRSNALIVIDDYHLLPDESKNFVRKMAEKIQSGRLFILTRKKDPRIPLWTGLVKEIELTPLDMESAFMLSLYEASKRGLKLGRQAYKIIVNNSGGIPLIIKGAIEYASRSRTRVEESVKTVVKTYYEGRVMEMLDEHEELSVKTLIVVGGLLPEDVLCRTLSVQKKACRLIIDSLYNLGLVTKDGPYIKAREFLYKAREAVSEEARKAIILRVAEVLSSHEDYKSRLIGLNLLAEECQTGLASRIISDRLEKGYGWMTCCIDSYSNVLEKLRLCRSQNVFDRAVINVEYALIKKASIENDLRSAIGIIGKHLPALKPNPILYSRICALYSSFLMKTGKIIQGIEWLNEAKRVYKLVPKRLAKHVESTIMATETLRYYIEGDLEKALEAALREAEIELERGDIRNYLVANVHVAVIQVYKGEFREALENVREIMENLDLFEEDFKNIMIDNLSGVHVWSLIGMGSYLEAEAVVKGYLSNPGIVKLRSSLVIARALLEYRRGDYEEVARVLEDNKRTIEEESMGDEYVIYEFLRDTVIHGRKAKDKLEKLSPGMKTIMEAILRDQGKM